MLRRYAAHHLVIILAELYHTFPKTVYPALEALAEIAKSADETWHTLVLDGVVRTLCWMVLDLVSFTNALTYLPSDLQQQADQAVSPVISY